MLTTGMVIAAGKFLLEAAITLGALAVFMKALCDLIDMLKPRIHGYAMDIVAFIRGIRGNGFGGEPA